MKFIFCVVILILFPSLALANVSINEIAWMGTDVSSNDEWIELYNNSSNDIDLDGWVIYAEDGQPEINLTGTIKANSFFLLERTDDSSVNSVVADLIYSGSLENGGEILILKDDNNVEVRRINAQDGWQAGDNFTKQTMQWSAGTWITADPTPKTINKLEEVVADSEQQQKEETASNTSVWPPEPQIYANAGENVVTVAGAGNSFSGQTLGINGEPLSKARYLWGFGDGYTKEGQNVTHFYKYPAKYIVVLNVSSGQYSTSDSLVVDVRKNELKIIEANNDYIKIKNGSSFDLDISRWFLRSDKKTFRFPKTTLVGANLELPIPSTITKIMGSNLRNRVEILYPNGVVAHSFNRFVQQKPVSVATAVEKTNEVPVGNITIGVEKNKEIDIEEEIMDPIQTAVVISSTQGDFLNTKNTFLIVLGSSLFVGISLVFSRHQKRNIADEFEIVE